MRIFYSVFSAYFQKYEIFVYESAKQDMDETFFPTWDWMFEEISQK